MTLIVVPRGRGNWRRITLKIEGADFTMFSFLVGDKLDFGGRCFWIAAVLES